MSKGLFDTLVELSEGHYKICGTKPNQYHTDPLVMSINRAGVDKFNRVYRILYDSKLNKIERTPRGAIAICRNNNYAYDVLSNRCGCRLTVVLNGYIFVWRIGRERFNASGTMGWQAWRVFVPLCEKHNIKLDELSIDNGREVKETIEPPLIRMLKCHTVLENVHHIDFHSSYASGLALTHPEFRPVIEELYAERKKKASYKDVLVCVIGYMQSVGRCSARWAHLAKDAIDNNNTRIRALTLQLQVSGREIIGYNTDGIWYQGPVFHDLRGGGEGPGIGQWSNDHVNTTFRAKSDGAYEFIENGVYHPVVRGFTNLDVVKDRKYWQWGDIYNHEASIMKWIYKEGVGLVEKEEEEEDEEDQEDL